MKLAIIFYLFFFSCYCVNSIPRINETQDYINQRLEDLRPILKIDENNSYCTTVHGNFNDINSKKDLKNHIELIFRGIKFLSDANFYKQNGENFESITNILINLYVCKNNHSQGLTFRVKKKRL